MSLLTANIKRVANKSTKLIGRYHGATIGQYYICEYPKSGGTWLGKMLADAMRLPYPAPAYFPVTFPAVIHNHWIPDARLDHVIYLMRDGRDVMVSYFFHRMRRLARGDANTVRIFKRTYDRLFGVGYDPDDTAALLPKFIEHEFRHPRGARLNWADHVRGWRKPKMGEITFVTYESLLQDCAGALTRVLTETTGTAPDLWTVETTVEKFSMQRLTGRSNGSENRTSFIRKGVAGDWRNHFTREAAEVFDRLAGDVLIECGYENDHAWVDTIGIPTESMPRTAASRASSTQSQPSYPPHQPLTTGS